MRTLLNIEAAARKQSCGGMDSLLPKFRSYSEFLLTMKRHLVIVIVWVCSWAITVVGRCESGVGKPDAGDPSAAKKETLRSLGVFVTLARLSAATAVGVQAIPQGAFVSVVENEVGQKFAVFRQIRLPISDLTRVSNDPAKIAAASAGGSGSMAAKDVTNLPGAVMEGGRSVSPTARTQQEIAVDEAGKVISRSKTTVIDDGAGNTTTIRQGRPGGVTGDQAASLAAAQQKINLQREAISELKAKRSQKAVMSGYQAKLREMTDLLTRMEIEFARMKVQ